MLLNGRRERYERLFCIFYTYASVRARVLQACERPNGFREVASNLRRRRVVLQFS